MLFRQLFDNISCTYTYLIAMDYHRGAVLIDPVLEKMPLYERLMTEYGLTLTATLDTHLHADHITASGQLREKYGSEIIMGDPCQANCVTRKIRDRETLSFDGFSMECFYTPGHTNDSYCYRMMDRVFTGDTLFIRGSGRTDFQNGCAKEAYHSIFDVLLKLPGDTLIYPGHDYQGQTVSTIDEEKQFNPRLQVSSAAEYVDMMNNLNLDRPKKMDIAVPANLVCGLVDETN